MKTADDDILSTIQASLAESSSRCAAAGRPYVTLSYAQSIDGSIACRSGRPLELSCRESSVFTHQLRSIHDGILVGIGTILADNPMLTVRHVNGNSPQPIVVDGRLRFPVDASLLQNHRKKPWIATAAEPDTERERALAKQGAKVIHIPFDRDGLIDLKDLLSLLLEMKIESLMVEGGAQIITSFLKHRLVDQLVLTMAPLYIGGMQAVWPLQLSLLDPPRLENVAYEMCGSDLVLRADIAWREP
jgi:GTP cyclohydrolase II